MIDYCVMIAPGQCEGKQKYNVPNSLHNENEKQIILHQTGTIDSLIVVGNNTPDWKEDGHLKIGEE